MVTKQQLQSMDPYEFEELVAELWESKGYTTNVRKKSGDKAVDIDAERGGRKEVIQVKRYSGDNKIGSKEVREYATLYQQTDANQVVLVTSGGITNQARELGPELGVQLIDGSQLVQELSSQKNINIQSLGGDTSDTDLTSTRTTKDSTQGNPLLWIWYLTFGWISALTGGMYVILGGFLILLFYLGFLIAPVMALTDLLYAFEIIETSALWADPGDGEINIRDEGTLMKIVYGVGAPVVIFLIAFPIIGLLSTYFGKVLWNIGLYGTESKLSYSKDAAPQSWIFALWDDDIDLTEEESVQEEDSKEDAEPIKKEGERTSHS